MLSTAQLDQLVVNFREQRHVWPWNCQILHGFKIELFSVAVAIGFFPRAKVRFRIFSRSWLPPFRVRHASKIRGIFYNIKNAVGVLRWWHGVPRISVDIVTIYHAPGAQWTHIPG